MIFGICGFQSSGKDTLANYLITEYGFIKFSFASKLKDIIAIMFCWPRDKLEGLTKQDREWRETVDSWWAEKLGITTLTPRYVMQYFATDLFRNHFHTDIWVNILENELNKCLASNPNQHIVISDCRFSNEIDMILNLGGKIIQVHRNPPSWFYTYRDGEYPPEMYLTHISEITWIRCYYDYDIDNSDTIEKFYTQIKYIVENNLDDK
jgi:hypothetical protein